MKFYLFYFGSVFRFIQNYLVYEAFRQKHTVMSMFQANRKDSTTYITQNFEQELLCLLDARNTFGLPIASVFAESFKDHKETKSKVIISYFYCFNILNK